MNPKKLLKNTYVLYGVLFIALTNILGYMSYQNYEAVIIFALVGFLTQYFSKNMIIILLVPIVFTALFNVFRRNVREGVVGDKKDSNQSTDNNKKDRDQSTDNSKKATPKIKACNSTDEAECNGLEGCSWDKPGKKCASSGMTTLHPKWIKDDEKTEQDFYKNLPGDVDDLGIHEMTKRTEDLAEKQKKST